ncbi:hypothetical protein BDN67DRAFT_985245 [Paxillus ammoniavirescens]|nr:hypothetical protein BDN67DRAFT_985245 [Paxillus ammoniavirescens]
MQPHTSRAHTEPKSQGRVERRREVDERGSKSTGRTDEEEAAARGPGRGATDQGASSISLAVASCEKDSPKTNVNTPKPPPLPQTTHNLLFKQLAPTSTRLANQRRQNSHIPCIEMCRTLEDDQGS